MSAAVIYIQGVDLLLKPPCLIKSQNFCLLKCLGDFFLLLINWPAYQEKRDQSIRIKPVM